MMAELNRTTWAALLAVLFFHAVLASLSQGNAEGTSLVRGLIVDALTPAEKLVDRTANAVSTLWRNYFGLIGVREENLRMRQELGSLRMELALKREAIIEADRLRRYFDLRPLVGDTRVVARVIGADATYSTRTVTIDKGGAHGVDVGSAVMTPDGVVGRVIESARYSSVVQLISDPLSAVGVLARSNRVQGVVRGQGAGLLELEHFGAPEDVAVGEVIVTSGTDRIYPKGLPVGVAASPGEARDLTTVVEIRPLADLDRLEEVLNIPKFDPDSPVWEPRHDPE